MSETAERFLCEGCQRKLPWKPEYAGRRVKCKCGHGMSVPAQPYQPEAEVAEDDLYALAEDAHRATANLPPTIVDPVVEEAPKPVKKPKSAGKAGGVPLAYQRVPSGRQAASAAAANVLIDPRRDFQVPCALIAIGAILYISFYAIHYNLGGVGILATGIGLTIMTILETIILVCFALVIAGPLGVSFGGVGTAILKLAAIAIFCDGVTTWVDGIFAKYSGGFGGGIMGFGAIGFPIALGIYWATMIYLFSMDPGDSWMVVAILSFFYRVIRTILLLLLLKMILGFGGVGGSAIALPSIGAGGSSADTEQNSIVDQIEEAKAHNLLHEAKKYAHDMGRSAEAGYINNWYDAGAVNVWFETDSDINGKGDATDIVVELPTDKAARAKCYDVLKLYYTNMGDAEEAKMLKDKGEPYLIVDLPFKQ